MSNVGVKIDQLDVPVCNSFRAKIVNDQLCYEIDLKKFSSKNNFESELELGFTFLMDYNEDRQVTFDKINKKNELGLTKSSTSSNKNEHAFVYLDTVGKIFKI